MASVTCLSGQLAAQDQAFIFGDEYIGCDNACGNWFVEFPVSDLYLYNWQIINGNAPNAEVVYEFQSEGYVPLRWCNIPPGSYTILLTVSGPDGNGIATGQYSFFVEDFSNFANGIAYGSHTTACEQDSFALVFPTTNADCYEVCVGSVSTLSLTEIILTDNAGGTTVVVDPSQGNWSVTNGQLDMVTPPETGNFNLPEVNSLPGQTVCLPLTVNNFDNILGFQFSINFDPSVVSFLGTLNFVSPLQGLTIGSLGNPTSDGSITVNWNTPGSGAGMTLDDGTAITQLCFQVLGNSSSALVFSDSPTTAVVFGANQQTIPFDGQNGAININTPAPTSITIRWDEAGAGRATYSFFYTNVFGCEVFAQIDFCFDVLDPPTANFTTQPPVGASGILEICEGQPVFFTSESTTAETYLWDFGDGGGSSLPNPQHTYFSAGSYEVALITARGCECADTSRLTIVVEGNDAPFVDCVATICEGTAVTYTATTGCSAYNWDISGNGTILAGGGSNDDFITIQWGAGPIGEITLETAGCPSLSTCTTAAYIQIPIVSSAVTIAGPERVCRGEQSVYSVPPFEGTTFNWTVSPFGTIIAGQGTPSVTIEWFNGPIPAAAQLVSVDYSNCYLGCGGSGQLDVQIKPEYYLTGTIEVCENGTADYAVVNTQSNIGFPANFSVVASDGSTVWTSPGAGPSFAINWTFGPGDYTVVAVPQNPLDYCTPVAEFPVKVLATPAAVSNIVGQSAICPGIAYTYRVPSPLVGQRYRWSVTNGGSTTVREGASIAVVWAASGPYALSVTRLSPPLFCASAATSLAISPVSGFTLSGDDQVCLDQLATYTSDQTGDVFYRWSIVPATAGTITGDPAADTIDVLWHSAGAATVVLDICGQQATFNVTVNAPPQPLVNHPAALCPGTTATVSTSAGYATYSWQDAEGNVLATTPTTDLGGGYYRLEVTDALGCLGRTTFNIYEYPASAISISTPDFTLFCNVPPLSNLYAVNTADGYTYQWLQNGTPIAGATGASYLANTYGNYQVGIVDENGCSFVSNVISLAENCGDIGGTGGGANCNNPGHNFTTTDNGLCNDRSFTAVATGSIPGSITWSFDDPGSGSNNFATGANASHVFSRPGFFRVRMVAAYDDGMGGQVLCRQITPETILAVANFDYDGVCPGAPVQFYDLTTYLSLTSIVAWSWDFGDPASGANNTATAKDPTHIFSGGGDYNVTLTITTAAGCQATTTQTVSIYPLPATTFAEPDVTCAATALAFVADVEATVADVSWNFGEPASGAANTSTLFNSYHSFGASGSYTVNLEATSVYGCVNNFSRAVSITPNGLAGEIDPAGLSNLCEGDTLTLTAPAGGATAWVWSNGELTPSIAVATAEAYTVTLTSAEGCTYTPAAAIVDVIPAPQSPIRAVTYNDFNQPTTYTYDTLMVCYGEPVFLETEQQAGYTYVWSTGDTDNNTEFSEDRGNLLTAGEYLITMTVTNTTSGCSAVEGFLVIVHPTPAIPLISSGPGTLCAGTNATLTVGNPAGDVVYFWSNGDSGTSVVTDEAGAYRVTAINAFGCRSDSEVTEILAGPDISLVPSGCHTRCAPDTLCLPTIPNVVSYQWYQDGTLIPAPAGSVPNLVINQSGVYTLEMQDASGCVQTSNPLTIELLSGFGTIQGQVFYDRNDNALIDAADSLAGSINVVLANSGGPLATITTDTLGNYGFVGVPEDNYTVSIDTLSVPAGWRPLIQSVDTTFVGCAQEVVLSWLLVPDCSFDTTFVASVCAGEDFVFNGQPYAIGTTNTVQLTPVLGCDTTFTFTVAALPTSTEVLAVQVCPGESYTYGGQAYPVGTDLTIALTNSVGCDSLIQLQVSALATSTTVLAVAVCPGESYAYQGQNYPIGTDVTLTLSGGTGCDSLVQLQVSASPTSTEVLAVQVCPGESYAYQGQTYPAGTNLTITLTNSVGCDSLIQLQVTEPPAAVVALATEDSCPGTGTGLLTATPTAGTQPFLFALDGGALQAAPSFTGLAPGSYDLLIEDATGCRYTENFFVDALPALVVKAADALLPCESNMVQLQPEILSGDDGQLQFLWSDGVTTLDREVTAPGTLQLQVSNGCESVGVSLAVTPEITADSDQLVYVPNAFSPNNDGANDAFQIYPNLDAQIEKLTFKVYNRWGEQVFVAQSWDDQWLGTGRGRLAPAGVYVWFLEATANVCGQTLEVRQQGEVLLIR
jgi:gliding motility-associated-like protein